MTVTLKVTVTFLLASVFLTATCARPDESWQHISESGTLRVGMDASFPPFEYIAPDGTLAGFDVELAQELGKRLGVEVRFTPNIPYDGLYDALAIGRVDAVISALVVNPQRMADFAYSLSYFDAGQVLVIPASSGAEIRGMSDLVGRRLAVEFGSAGDMEVRRRYGRNIATQGHSDATPLLVHYETAAEAREALRRGEVDAALVDHVSALGGCDEDEWLIVGEPIVSMPYAVAVRRESSSLLRAINEALAQMQADGTLDRLMDRWLCGVR
ncbi:MAG: transporter substrate-binding domain-containing protein [Anaerolineae bacterium]|nr:transporter substrate-binding domain-containing protein [Anaerolineae bacterium]